MDVPTPRSRSKPPISSSRATAYHEHGIYRHRKAASRGPRMLKFCSCFWPYYLSSTWITLKHQAIPRAPCRIARVHLRNLESPFREKDTPNLAGGASTAKDVESSAVKGIQNATTASRRGCDASIQPTSSRLHRGHPLLQARGKS